MFPGFPLLALCRKLYQGKVRYHTNCQNNAFAWQQLSSLQVDLKVLLNHLHNYRSIETNNNNNNKKKET